MAPNDAAASIGIGSTSPPSSQRSPRSLAGGPPSSGRSAEAAGADVKLHGIIVGRVDSIEVESDSRGALLDLAIDRDQLDLIPENVTAQVVPKTIFGEKYVDLTFPVEPADSRLADGSIIERDRSSVAIETRTVLNNLAPLLDAVSPADLNTTLTAISTALDGRGEDLGRTITQARRFTDLARPTVPSCSRMRRSSLTRATPTPAPLRRFWVHSTR